MNELTPATVIVEAHRILKNLVMGQVEVTTQVPAALHWLEDRQMIEEVLDESGALQYEVTRWGRVALLGRQAA